MNFCGVLAAHLYHHVAASEAGQALVPETRQELLAVGVRHKLKRNHKNKQITSRI